MTVAELIEDLEEVAEENGEDTPVRLAMQPSWPMQYDIKGIGVAVGLDDPETDDTGAVCYLIEAGQVDHAPYLPGEVAAEIGWR